MENKAFKFHIQNLANGWCRVVMLINDKEIYFNAEYMGPNPLESLVGACAELMEMSGQYHIKWIDKFMILRIDMELDESNMLHLGIIDQREDGSEIYGEWHEVIPFEIFVSEIISEGFRVLYAFGLYGYRKSWQNHEDFPLTNLLRITGKCKEMWQGDSCCTNISKEIECLQEFISKLRITEETKMDVCTIFYELWQLQCCGEPFSVGDKVDWTCIMPTEEKNAHGIILDLEEEHHGFATHSVTGTVTKILVERSEFPKGKREVWYNRAKVIHEEIQSANGWESELKSDETTDRTFWGYVVTLKDATIKPLNN